MRIPRLFHYIWLGQEPLHPLMLEWQDGWRRLHPDWEIKLWRDDPELPIHILHHGDELIECRHRDYLASCSPVAKQSDVWRYDILEQQGGVYLDTDMEPLKCLEPLIDDAPAFAGLCTTYYCLPHGGQSRAPGRPRQWNEVGCSIMGAVPHHPWIRKLVHETPARDRSSSLSLAFPFTTSTIGKHPDVVLFDPEVFYSVPWTEYALGGRRSLRKRQPPLQAHAVHRWSSAWLPHNPIR